MIKVLYVTEDGKAHGVVGGTMKVVSESFASMTDEEKANAFTSLDEGNAAAADIQALEKFKIYAYTQDSNVVGIAQPEASTGAWEAADEDGCGAYAPHCIVSATMKSRLVRPKALLPFGEDVSSIINMSLSSAESDDHPAFVLVTTDLENYKSYNFDTNAWRDVNVSHDDEAANTSAALADGIRASKLSAIPESAWNLLGTPKIAIAYCLKDAGSFVLALSAKIRMKGSWAEAANGTDYIARYTSPTNLSIIFLDSGDYKVNYPDGDGTPESRQVPFGIKNIDANTWNYIDTRGEAIK